MRSLSISFIGVLIFASIIQNAFAKDVTTGIPPGTEFVGLIQFHSNGYNLDTRARYEIYSLIPKLRKLAKGKIVRIEGHFDSCKNKDEYTLKSLYLAKEVEHYLRVQEGLQFDLYIAAMDDKIYQDNSKIVRIVLYPKEFTVEKIQISRKILGDNL